MEDIIYITPNGTEVDEATLRNKYGERFDQFVSEGLLKKRLNRKYGLTIGSWHFGFTRA